MRYGRNKTVGMAVYLALEDVVFRFVGKTADVGHTAVEDGLYWATRSSVDAVNWAVGDVIMPTTLIPTPKHPGLQEFLLEAGVRCS
jgi:hypothetical protein